MTRLEAADYFLNKTWSQICLTYERLPLASSEVKFINSLVPSTFSITVLTVYLVFMMMMIMNCFCGMVDRRKAFSLIFSRDHCQRSSSSRISDTPRAGFEPAQNLSSDFVEWSCAVVLLTSLPILNINFQIKLYTERKLL